MWAHAGRRICVALSVLAKPMKLSRSGRKGDRFQQQSWRLWSFRRVFFSFLMTSERILPLQTLRPERGRKRSNGMNRKSRFWTEGVFCPRWQCFTCLQRALPINALLCFRHKIFSAHQRAVSSGYLWENRNSIEKLWFLKWASWQATTSSKIPAQSSGCQTLIVSRSSMFQNRKWFDIICNICRYHLSLIYG